jgi:hypothetical protein
MFFSIAIFAAFLVAPWACDSDDQELVDVCDGCDNMNDDDEACLGNQAPELLSLAVLVNGEPAEMPLQITLADELDFRFEYADADCNLDGGVAAISWQAVSDPGMEGGGPTWDLIGVGCSSDEAGGPFLISSHPGDFTEQVDGFVLGFELHDDCGGTSNRIELQIETD